MYCNHDSSDAGNSRRLCWTLSVSDASRRFTEAGRVVYLIWLRSPVASTRPFDPTAHAKSSLSDSGAILIPASTSLAPIDVIAAACLCGLSASSAVTAPSCCSFDRAAAPLSESFSPSASAGSRSSDHLNALPAVSAVGPETACLAAHLLMRSTNPSLMLRSTDASRGLVPRVQPTPYHHSLRRSSALPALSM